MRVRLSLEMLFHGLKYKSGALEMFTRRTLHSASSQVNKDQNTEVKNK